MKLTNDSYVITMGTKNFTETYYKDKDGWLKVSAKGNIFRMTAEQLLNHLLPAIAEVKAGIEWKVEYKPNKQNLNIMAPRIRVNQDCGDKYYEQLQFPLGFQHTIQFVIQKTIIDKCKLSSNTLLGET